MKRKSCVGSLLVFLMAVVPLLLIPSMEGARAAEPVTLSVYDPTGAIEVTQLFAPRLADLNGKNICLVSNAAWESDRTLPLIGELLQKQFPAAKIIPYSEFPVGSEKIDVNSIGDIVKKKGCQAAIVGNAG